MNELVSNQLQILNSRHKEKPANQFAQYRNRIWVFGVKEDMDPDYPIYRRVGGDGWSLHPVKKAEIPEQLMTVTADYPEGTWAQISEEGTAHFIPINFLHHIREDLPLYIKGKEYWERRDMKDIKTERHLNILALRYLNKVEGTWAQFIGDTPIFTARSGWKILKKDQPLYRRFDYGWDRAEYSDAIVEWDKHILDWDATGQPSGSWVQVLEEGVKIWKYPEKPGEELDRSKNLYYLDGSEWVLWTEELELEHTGIETECELNHKDIIGLCLLQLENLKPEQEGEIFAVMDSVGWLITGNSPFQQVQRRFNEDDYILEGSGPDGIEGVKTHINVYDTLDVENPGSVREYFYYTAEGWKQYDTMDSISDAEGVMVTDVGAVLKLSNLQVVGWVKLENPEDIGVRGSTIYEEIIAEKDEDGEEYTGSSVSYYTVWIENPTTEGRGSYHAECNDIIEALEMNYAEGNAFKALWRRASARQGLQKRGYDNGLYDAEKVEFFGKRLVEQSKEKL